MWRKSEIRIKCLYSCGDRSLASQTSDPINTLGSIKSIKDNERALSLSVYGQV